MSSDALREHLKTKLLNLNYTLYSQHTPADAGEAVRQLTAYDEK